MKSFKEQIADDLGSVFLNLTEFAEQHRIEGKTIDVVIDNDQMVKMKNGQILGMVEADVLLYGRSSDFAREPSPGSLFNLDGKELMVVASGSDMGLTEVALKQNRTY